LPTGRLGGGGETKGRSDTRTHVGPRDRGQEPRSLFISILISRITHHKNNVSKITISQMTSVLCSVNTSFTAAPAMLVKELRSERL
jgi:hypothetical protein